MNDLFFSCNWFDRSNDQRSTAKHKCSIAFNFASITPGSSWSIPSFASYEWFKSFEQKHFTYWNTIIIIIIWHLSSLIMIIKRIYNISHKGIHGFNYGLLLLFKWVHCAIVLCNFKNFHYLFISKFTQANFVVTIIKLMIS